MTPPQDPITTSPPSRDPGTRLSLIAATLLALLSFFTVAIWQAQSARQTPPQTSPARINTVNPQADMAFRMIIKLSWLIESDPGSVRMLGGYATTPLEQIYFAIALGEIEGPQAAIDALDKAKKDAKDPQILADIDTFRHIYNAALQNTASETLLDPVERDGLIDRHGFYARVALTYPLPQTDPQRQGLRQGAGAILALIVLVFVIAGAILVGFALFVAAIVMLALGRIKPRFAPPAPGGSVFLEVFALFVLGFLCLKIATLLVERFMGNDTPAWLGPASLGAQWLLLLVPLWPLLRGMRFTDWQKALGLHAERGLFREVALGILSYLAFLPVYLAAVGVVIVLMLLRDLIFGPTETPPSNPIVDIMTQLRGFALVLFFLTAVVWAPLCEELVFRGALYRHLRGWMPSLLAALVSATVFAFMHSYGALLTPPLIALGFAFAMMREWRGSIFASMTAHALHNATLMTLLFVLLSALGDA